MEIGFHRQKDIKRQNMMGFMNISCEKLVKNSKVHGYAM